MRSLLITLSSAAIALTSFTQSSLLSQASPSAPGQIPSDLVGIWATDGSDFRGEALVKGQGLYLDVDGIGAMVGGNGGDVMGARIVVTAYNPSANALGIDITEYGKVLFSSTLVYDPVQKTIVSPKDQNRIYHRRLDGLSAEIRKSLGLEPRADTITPPHTST